MVSRSSIESMSEKMKLGDEYREEKNQLLWKQNNLISIREEKKSYYMENFTIKNSKKINLTINWRLRISRSFFSSLLNLFLVRRNYFNAVKSKSISKYVSEQSRG